MHICSFIKLGSDFLSGRHFEIGSGRHKVFVLSDRHPARRASLSRGFQRRFRRQMEKLSRRQKSDGKPTRQEEKAHER